MNILVCIKSDMSGEDIGPFEALALEAGLCLKEAWASVEKEPVRVDVLTAGPPGRVGILRRALGMGADKGFHILTRSENPIGLISASVTSTLLSRTISHSQFTPAYDLVLTGVMSQDLMAGQTGPMTAEYLNFALATDVVEILPGEMGVTALREWEGGIRETLKIPFPALISIQAGEYTPRYPSLSNMLRARSKSIKTLTPEELGLEKADRMPHEFFGEISIPEKTRAGKVIGGSVPEQVRGFKSFLKERALI